MSKMRTMLVSAVLGTALVASVTGAAAQSRAASSSPQAAATDTWQLLATRTAGRLAGHDTIMLEPPYQKFNSIKFASKDAAVHIKKFLATYDNGVTQEVYVDEKVHRDAESQPFKLQSKGRSLTKIEVWYDTAGVERDARVSLFGMK